MDSRFDVSISYIDRDGKRDHGSLKFYPKDILAKQKIDIFNTKIPCAQEYHTVLLDFWSGDSDARMMIPDLNDYDIRGSRRDSKNKKIIYFQPQNNIPIYLNNDEHVQPVPLSIDIYTIIIKIDGHKYYSYFRVVSKELQSVEWEKMISDLEQVSNEMTHENIRKYHRHLGLSSSEQAKILFQPLVGEYKDIMIYIHLILDNPRYKIAKSYHWVKLGKEQFIDQITVRKMNEMPTVNGWIYAPHRYLNYDIEDNRWIKFIIFQILKRTNLAIKYYGSKKHYLVNSQLHVREHNFYGHSGSERGHDVKHYDFEFQTLSDNINRLSKLRNYLFYVLHNSMLSNLHRIKGFIPKGLVLSPKYNKLYRLYLELKNSNINNRHVPQIEQYRYKPTSELYEVWTVLKVIQALEQGGYKGIKGWIFDDHLVVPTLRHGTKVFMKNDKGIYLVVVYNKSLSTRVIHRWSDKPFNNGEEPVYVPWWHNKPDIRVDIFKNKATFLGSIILDAKYKKISSLLKFKRGSGSVHDQLLAYSEIGPKISVNGDNIGAVPVVYALYPSKDNKNESLNYKTYRDNHIKLAQLRPDNHDTFVSFVKDINNIINSRISRIEQKVHQAKMAKWAEMIKYKKS